MTLFAVIYFSIGVLLAYGTLTMFTTERGRELLAEVLPESKLVPPPQLSMIATMLIVMMLFMWPFFLFKFEE